MIKRNLLKLFQSRKGHLDYRINRDYVRNGIVTIPCRVSDYSDVISSYSVKNYETLNPEFVDYLKSAAEVAPPEYPIILNIVEDCLSQEEKQAILGEYDADCAVKTRTGVYVGEKHGETLVFMGIPYAKPPVGKRRWKAPEPLPASKKVFEARNSGASAIQVEHKGSIIKNHRQSEDCLTLNIAVGTQKTEAKKPVLVLFHHGDFTYDSAVDPCCSGAILRTIIRIS